MADENKVLDESGLIDDGSSFFSDLIEVADDQRTAERANETAGAETIGAEAAGEQPGDLAGAQGAEDFIFIGNDGLPGAIISDRIDDEEEEDQPLIHVEDLWSGLRPIPKAPTASRAGAEAGTAEAGAEAGTAEAGAEAGTAEAGAEAGTAEVGTETAGGEGENGVPIAPVLGALGQLAGHHFEGTEAFVEHYERLIDERDGFGALQELLQNDAPANQFIGALLKGETAQAAAAEHIPGLTSSVPEDPEEAAAYWQQVGQKEAQAQTTKSQRATNATGKKRIADKAGRAFAATVEKLGLTEAQRQEFLHDASIIQAGDLSRQTIRPDTYEVLHNGLHFDTLVAAREEAAFKRGVEQGLKGAQARARGHAPALPTITGGGGQRAAGRRADANTPAARALGVIDSLASSEGQAIFNAF